LLVMFFRLPGTTVPDGLTCLSVSDPAHTHWFSHSKCRLFATSHNRIVVGVATQGEHVWKSIQPTLLSWLDSSSALITLRRP